MAFPIDMNCDRIAYGIVRELFHVGISIVVRVDTLKPIKAEHGFSVLCQLDGIPMLVGRFFPTRIRYGRKMPVIYAGVFRINIIVTALMKLSESWSSAVLNFFSSLK